MVTGTTPPLVPARELTSQELIDRFEDRTLDPASFRHAEHVRLAWAFLQRLELFPAMERCRLGLRALAAHHGAPEKYHETVTCGMMVLVHERLLTRGSDGTWDGFVAANPDLLRWLDGAFFEHYPPEVLRSELARRTFLLPHSVPHADETAQAVASGNGPRAGSTGDDERRPGRADADTAALAPGART